ncbi:MAG TPA: aldose 1-epimerase, partial [Rhizobacter sp.]|nr:aldose 1-epimerase [Rhizobacter sp.]
RQSASYPLVPYSNRLGYRHFRWKGKDYTTAPNFDDNPHSVHGVGWLRRWELVSSDISDLELRYRHEPDAHWPFPFEVTQYFTLTPQQLGVQMVFTNTAAIAQPVGLGWHPYFPKRERSRLHIELSSRWESDATQLPTRKVAQPGIDGDVSHLNFDHCFEGWNGPARIRDEKFSMQLTSSESYLVVYTPPEKAYFCVEPVSHVSNAVHMADPAAHGLKTLPAGETANAWMKLDIQAL